MATMTLWADYVTERLGWSVLYEDDGFIAYHIVPPNLSIEELYVRPEARETGLARHFADRVILEGRQQGCTKVWTTVRPGYPGAERAMKIALAYGFRMMRNDGDATILMKEI